MKTDLNNDFHLIRGIDSKRSFGHYKISSYGKRADFSEDGLKMVIFTQYLEFTQKRSFWYYRKYDKSAEMLEKKSRNDVFRSTPGIDPKKEFRLL